MNEDQARRAIYFGANEIETVFGTSDALDEIDAVTAALIVEYIKSRPAMGRADRVALVAISLLAETEAGQARQLMAELLGR